MRRSSWINARRNNGYGRLKRARDNLSGTESNTNEIELQYVQGRDFVLNLISKIFDESDDAVPPAGTRKEYITTYTHDLLGRVTKKERKGLSGGETPLVSTYGYNSLGMLTFYEAPNQQANPNLYNKTTFDVDGRWVEFVKRAGPNPLTDRIRLTSSYVDKQAGSKNTLITRQDGRGFETKHEYDAAYRLIEAFRPGYNEGAPRRHKTSFVYDVASRIQTITDGNNNVITPSYDLAGRILSRGVTVGAGVAPWADYEGFTYDDIGRL